MSILKGDYDGPATELRLFWDRKAASEADAEQIRRISVEAHLNLPRLCEIEAGSTGDAKVDDFGRSGGKVGDTVQVFAYAPGSMTGDIVFRGIIVSREIRHEPGYGKRVVLRAYDKSYEMTAATRTRAFKDMSYGEVAKKVASTYGLDSLLDSTITTSGPVHSQVVQANESDWDFLVRLAREQGWVVFVRCFTRLTVGDASLYFGPPMPAKGSVSKDVTFQPGDLRIRSMRASVTNAGVPSKVAVPGWDDLKGRAAVGDGGVSSSKRTTTSATTVPKSRKAGTVTTLETFAATVPQAERAAKGAATRRAGGAVDVTMVIRGNPMVKLNRLIKLDKAGDATGVHTVSGLVHVHEPYTGGFTTEVFCTGLDDRTLGGLAGPSKPAPRFHGIYPGTITDINDPRKLGRVKVALPWLSKEYVTGWVRVLQLGAGEKVGFQFLPRPKDEVVVAFENGQLDSPFVLGSVFGNASGKLPASSLVENGVPVIAALTTKAGHQLIFDDSANSSSVTLQATNGDSCIIKLDAKKGITITTMGERPVTVKSGGDVNVEAGKSAKVTAKDVSVDATGPVTVKSKGKVDVRGTNVTVDATSNLTLKGASVSVEAATSLTLKGSAAVTVKGGVVKLN